jgi:hypothetical protein
MTRAATTHRVTKRERGAQSTETTRKAAESTRRARRASERHHPESHRAEYRRMHGAQTPRHEEQDAREMRGAPTQWTRRSGSDSKPGAQRDSTRHGRASEPKHPHLSPTCQAHEQCAAQDDTKRRRARPSTRAHGPEVSSPSTRPTRRRAAHTRPNARRLGPQRRRARREGAQLVNSTPERRWYRSVRAPIPKAEECRMSPTRC